MSIISDLISSGLAGILQPIASIFNKQADASVEKFKVDGKVDAALVNAHIQLGLAKLNNLKDKWIIATQIFFAVPVGIFFWKCVVWDKVLAWGSTDPLGGDIQIWAGMIMAYLFASNALDKWNRKT